MHENTMKNDSIDVFLTMYRMTFAWQTMISNSCLGCGANALLVSEEDVANVFVSSDPDGVAAAVSVAEDGRSAR